MEPSSRAFNVELLLSESEWIRSLARSLVGDRDAAEDVVQETLLAALRRRPAVRESLRPWLARVLRNQAALRLRRTRRAARDRAEQAASECPSTAELVERAETHKRLVAAVIELNEPYRTVVLLRYYHGLAPAEIAARRGLPGATVRTQLRRGLERLRCRLDDENQGDRRAWMAALSPLAGLPSASTAAPLLAALAVALVVAGGLAAAFLGGSGEDSGSTGRVALAAAASDVETPAGVSLASGERASAPAPVRVALPSLPPSGRAPLAGRVLDAGTGEPLPYFQIELRGEGDQRATATTGAEGRFETGEPLSAGAYEVLLIDHPMLRQRAAENEPGPRTQAVFGPGSEPDLEAPVGPTYLLQIELPPGLELGDLTAHLRVPQDFRTSGWDLHLAPLRGPEGDRHHPWVRFAELEARFFREQGPFEIEVTSSDGLWAGSAPVSVLAGVERGVSIELSARGVVSGTVRDGAGPAAAAVVLRRLDEPADERRAPAGEDGAYRFAWVEPGRYSLVFESPRHVPLERELWVEGGERQAQDALLERRAGGGSVEGILTSRSGTYRGTVILALAPLTDQESVTFATARWNEEDGVLRGRFRFKDVAAGQYGLRVFSCSDQLEWNPPAALVPAPGRVEFECLDDVERVDLGVHAVDAASRVELSEVSILYQTGQRSIRLERTSEELFALAGEGFVWRHVPGPFPIRGFPVHGTLRWMVASPGYRPAYGDESAFVVQDGGRRADVALQAGWGLQLLFADVQNGAPLPGVRVLADGEPIATSGEDGICRLAGPARPLCLDFELDGHTLAGSDLDPADPPACARRFLYEVRLDGR